jgi:hypothetical protein
MTAMTGRAADMSRVKSPLCLHFGIWTADLNGEIAVFLLDEGLLAGRVHCQRCRRR